MLLCSAKGKCTDVKLYSEAACKHSFGMHHSDQTQGGIPYLELQGIWIPAISPRLHTTWQAEAEANLQLHTMFW